MRTKLLRLLLEPVESLVAHELFELVGEFAGIDVVAGRHRVAVRMEAVCHGGDCGGERRGGEKVTPTAAGLDGLVLQDGGWMEQWMSRVIEDRVVFFRLKKFNEMDNKLSSLASPHKTTIVE